MCTHCDVTSVGGDGEDMGSAIECADSHPPTIVAETHILDLEKEDLALDGERANSISGEAKRGRGGEEGEGRGKE